MSNYIASLVDPFFRQARRFPGNLRESSTQNTAGGERQRANTTGGSDESGQIQGDNGRPRRGTWTGGSVIPSQPSSRPASPIDTYGRNSGIDSARSGGSDSEHQDLSSLARIQPQTGLSQNEPPLNQPGTLEESPGNRVHVPPTSWATSNPTAYTGSSSNGGDSHNSSDWRNPQPAGQTFASTTPSWDSTLPADDGMSALRQKIHTIRKMEVSSTEKARLIHSLMTESYRSVQPLHSPKSPTSRPSPSHQNQERPYTPVSPRSKQSVEKSPLTPASGSSASTPAGPYNLCQDDLETTYVPRRSRRPNDVSGLEGLHLGAQSDNDADEEIVHLGCEHYKRNVKLQCHTCTRWYTCRFCHDSVEDHLLERRKTEYMLCMLCKFPQPASQWCKSCGVLTASYYCSICKLWDNDVEKAIYHCNDCGICRLGQGLGKDYFHCKTCAVCIPISIETTHRCIESSTKCDCPICGDYMFTSPDSVILMRCGHSMHHKCYSEYTKASYRCPICAKTIRNMETEFRSLDRTIEAQPMPPEYNGSWAIIHCNDCRAKSSVKFHWLGMRCDICESYNTNHMESHSSGDHQSTQERRTMHDQAITDPAQHPLPSSPTTAPSTWSGGGERAHLSPSSTNGRRNVLASSPRVINYFGTSPRRDESHQHMGTAADSDDDDFWGARLLNVLGSSEKESDDEENSVEPDEDDTDEDEEDDDDVIDIFGHR